jgi:N-acetylmuramoyl-L-alanine amidase
VTRDDVHALGDVGVLALTLFGETRNQPIEGKVAVGCVVRNRVRAKTGFGGSFSDVCLAPNQFSCWAAIGGPENYQTVMAMAQAYDRGDWNDPIFRECQYIAVGIVGDHLRDNSGGALYYLTRELFEAKPPLWARRLKLSARIGAHVFLTD